MKTLKATAILLIGPLLGLLIAFFLGTIVLPLDRNFAANGQHAAPGDGFLIISFMFVSLIISVPVSALLALSVLFPKKTSNQR